MTTHREPYPPSGPTNGRPWPGTRVTIKATGGTGVVAHYEWGWHSHTFPVIVDHPYGVTRMLCASDIADVAPNAAPVTPLTPRPTTTTDTTDTTGTPRITRQGVA